MLLRRFSITGTIFVLFFLIQEAVVNQLSFPAGGFSIFLILALIWAALSTPIVGALCGFVSGFFLDLSQSSSAAMGHWTLIMILACYAVAFLGSGNDNVRGNPITNVFLVSAASVVTLLAFVLTGLLLGVSTGGISRIALTVFVNGIWALLVTPLILPILSKIHLAIFGNKAHL